MQRLIGLPRATERRLKKGLLLITVPGLIFALLALGIGAAYFILEPTVLRVAVPTDHPYDQRLLRTAIEKKTPTWFAFDETRPLAAFAGIWTTWTGSRGPKSKPITGQHQLFGFLTTDANAEVGAIHPKAMPVILRTEEEIETWMTAPTEDALKLQRPLPDDALKIVMTGEKEDAGKGS